MKKNKFSVPQLLRHAIQLIAFLLIPGLFILVLNAIKDVYQAILAGTFTLAAQGGSLLILLAVLPVTALWGRFFCGFLCAFGSMQELLGAIGRKLGLPQLRPGKKAQRWLRVGKYLVLALLAVAWTLQISLDAFSPWTVFGRYSSLKGWLSLSGLLTYGGLLLGLILVGSLFSERFFCRYLCPLGGIFAGISRLRLFRVKKDRRACVGCGACDTVCPMGVDVNEGTQEIGRLRSGECIDCFRCTGRCPCRALSTNPGEALSGSLASAAIAGMYLVGTVVPLKTAAMTASAETAAITTTAARFADGVYYGTGSGYRGDTEVSVTVENSVITEIEVLSTRDDSQFFNRAESGVISEILAAQSWNVKEVSGATYSSRAIMQAVQDALEGVPTLEIPAESEAQTSPAAVESAGKRETASASSAVENGTFSDGVFTGTGKGRNGNITVSVTVENGQITAIDVESASEDRQYFNRAVSVLDSVIANQSVQVQAVSGATMSSRGLLEAVANALGLEYTNTNSESSHGHGGHGRR